MIKSSGVLVWPGDIVYDSPILLSEASPEAASGTRRIPVVGDRDLIIASVVGSVQCEDKSIGVLPAKSSSPVVPSPGSIVSMRITQVTRQGCQGDITSVHDERTGEEFWCYLGGQNTFRGWLRSEDIRPVVLVDKGAPPAEVASQFPVVSVTSSGTIILPAHASFRPGDLVIARVISQMDTKMFQLTTQESVCGCIESKRRDLEIIPGRRDAMKDIKTGKEVGRWTPLVTATRTGKS